MNEFTFRQTLKEYGLSTDDYKSCVKDIADKVNGINDLDWQEIVDKYSLPMTADKLRKTQALPFGGVFMSQFYAAPKSEDSFDEKLREMRKERIKIQTANVERNRIDRAEARQEMYYEQVANVIRTLPLPDFNPVEEVHEENSVEYVCCLSDIHYGASYKSMNNEYSPDIFAGRLEYLYTWLLGFIKEHKLNKIVVLELGDTIQGCLRISDLKLNETSVVKAIVEVSRLIAMFLNKLSEHIYIDYYHTPFANHTQLRFLGAKASELSDEDVEYVIGNYIKDMLADNLRVKVHLADENVPYIKFECAQNEIIAMHGHNIRNNETALKDLNALSGNDASYLILGHCHGAKNIVSHEGVVEDCEVLIAPSICGSDHYSDSIMKGSKSAVVVYGFNFPYGHTETYKCILS